MAFNNSIALAEKFAPLLDEVYKKASITSLLDTTNGISFDGANKVSYYQMTMDALGDYTRNTGYTDGAVTGVWKNFTLAKDRGRRFMVDVMDNEESLGMAFGKLAGEFIRTQVVPEIDAYRFAKYAQGAGLSATGALTSTKAVCDAIDSAELAMADEEIDLAGAIIFMNNTVYKKLKGEITRTTEYNAQGVAFDVESYDGMRIVRVPQGRFWTKCITNSNGFSTGTTGDSAKAIDFLIVKPETICQVVKHEAPKFIAPEANQIADAWMYFYRIYHDCFVFDNKKKGIYLHTAD